MGSKKASNRRPFLFFPECLPQAKQTDQGAAFTASQVQDSRVWISYYIGRFHSSQVRWIASSEAIPGQHWRSKQLAFRRSNRKTWSLVVNVIRNGRYWYSQKISSYPTKCIYNIYTKYCIHHIEKIYNVYTYDILHTSRFWTTLRISMAKSKVLNLRISPELKKKARLIAEEDGRSLSNWITYLITREVKKAEKIEKE